MEWDQDDFKLPALPDAKLELTDFEDPLKYIWQDEATSDYPKTGDEACHSGQKLSPPSVQTQPASLKWIVHESDQNLEENLKGKEGGPSSMQSDDEDLNLDKKMLRRQLSVGETFLPDVDHVANQDDSEIPPLPKVKLELKDFEDPLQYIWQDEAASDYLKTGDEACHSDSGQKLSPPSLQSQPPSLKWIFNESDQLVEENLKGKEGVPGSMESDDEDLYLEKKIVRRQLGVGETFPPDVDHLTSMLKPDNGKPKNLCARVWICPNCRASYNGSKNFICDIQTYKCSHCDFQNPVSYSWSLTRVELNGVSLDFSKVYAQLRKDDNCLLYGFLSLCDMMRRIRDAKHGWDEATPFDHHLMLSLYKEVSGWDLDESPFLTCASGSDHPHIEIMLKAAIMNGVPYSSLTLFDRALLKGPGESLSVPKRSLKIKSWFRVSGADIEAITRLLGHGFPLLATVPIGKCFRFLPSGEIYHPPSANECIPQGPKDEDCCVTHAVVLHGSGVAMPECKLSLQGNLVASAPCEGVYFKGRNSHGMKAHPSWEKSGEGADFNVWAADLFDDVYGINLLDFDD